MRIDVETVVRRSAKRVGQYCFHVGHGMEARKVLLLIESKYGKADPANLRLADSYARDVFGDSAIGLRAATAMHHRRGRARQSVRAQSLVPLGNADCSMHRACSP